MAQRRVSSLHNITALGLAKRVDKVHKAYERVKNNDEMAAAAALTQS